MYIMYSDIVIYGYMVMYSSICMLCMVIYRAVGEILSIRHALHKRTGYQDISVPIGKVNKQDTTRAPCQKRLTPGRGLLQAETVLDVFRAVVVVVAEHSGVVLVDMVQGVARHRVVRAEHHHHAVDGALVVLEHFKWLLPDLLAVVVQLELGRDLSEYVCGCHFTLSVSVSGLLDYGETG